MKNKYLTGAYPGGYALAATYTGLVVEATATVGGNGVSAAFFAAIQNDGAVNATTAGHDGVALSAGGIVTNGSATDATALIEGYNGVVTAGARATVANFGTIRGVGVSSRYIIAGVHLWDGGIVTNGSAADTTALIDGQTAGVLVRGVHIGAHGPSATIANFGTIEAAAVGSSGVDLRGGGTVTNGSAADTAALIKGVFAGYATAHIANYGTISGSYTGVNLGFGGTLTNGSAADATALIEGAVGVFAHSRPTTITNFGTIASTVVGGTAVDLREAPSELRVETGCVFIGAVMGDGSTLDLASGVGTISGLSGGNVTVSGSMATTTFTNFGTLAIAQGAAFTLTGTGTLRAGGTTTLVDEGTLDVAGTIAGTGTLAITGGALTLNAGAGVSVANWSLSGGAAADVNKSLTYAGAFSIQGSSLTLGGGKTLALSGAAMFGAGAVVNGAGTLTLTNATLAGLTVGGTAVVNDVGVVDQTGTIDLSKNAKAARLTIANGAIYKLDGDVGVARRASVNPVIAVDGLFIKSAGTGVSAVGVNVADAGTIEAATGTLSFIAGVSGAGTMKIDAGATLEFANTVANTLTASFAGVGAALALSKADAFAATIAGFAAGETIDLVNTAATSAVLNGGDQLAIANGATAVATLQLTGNYAGDSFNVAADGAGGTAITLSTGGAAVPVHGFIAAMATLAARADAAPATAWTPPDAWRPILSAPRMRIA